MTAAPELEEYVTNANVFLDDRSTGSNPMSVGELLGVLSQLVPAPAPGSAEAAANASGAPAPAEGAAGDAFMGGGGGGSGDGDHNNEDDGEDNEPLSNEPPQEPTPADWENLIIPELRRYLQREQNKPYVIDVCSTTFG